jgi:small subunit ribosomal protein S6
MEQKKRWYETTFIINASLEDNQIDGVIEKAKDFIVKNGGEIKELFKWGRKRFTYTIEKKNNGFYVVCMFSAVGDFVAKLERYFFLDDNILRSLVIKLDKDALANRLGAAELSKQGTVDTIPVVIPEEPAIDVKPLVPAEKPEPAE